MSALDLAAIGLWVPRRAASAEDHFLGARDNFAFLQLAFGCLLGRFGAPTRRMLSLVFLAPRRVRWRARACW